MPRLSSLLSGEPPPQPATMAPTTTARIIAKSFLPAFINLPCSSQQVSRCVQEVLSWCVPTGSVLLLRGCRFAPLAYDRLRGKLSGSGTRPGSHANLRTGLRLTFGIVRLGIGPSLGAREELTDTALALLARRSAAKVPRNPVEVDGDDHDPYPPDERPTHIELAETPDHGPAQAPRPNECGDDHHREREHDHLIDAGHDRRKGLRQ